jgi:hypothetical protein
MRFRLIKRPARPAKPTFDPEEIMLRANALFRAEQSTDLESVIAEKIEGLRQYDVLTMDRIVAVLPWGRSGSLLLSSYLDGHEDVIMLPELCGWNLHHFFELYQSLPLRDKLLAYTVFEPGYTRFFDGDFAISPTQYYAAVQAILEVYRKWPPEFLESRRAFFLFVHIAYNLALGRRSASSHPLIVFAQHSWDNVLAQYLVEDFPQAKFVHTIRDPITLSGQILADRLLPSERLWDSKEIRPVAKNPFLTVATWCVAAFPKLVDLLHRRRFQVLSPINGDRPQFGMESRTLAIRFEDLHCNTAETMRDLSDWLGLSYQATLTESTFNGIPYVVTRDGVAWSGRRPEKAHRNLRYISLKDRALLFALFYKNFVAWNYPYPKIFGNPIVRCLVFATLVLLPMKIEIMAAQTLFQSVILPSLRPGRVLIVIKSLIRIAFYRLALIVLFVLEFVGRCAGRKTLLHVGHKRAPLEPCVVGTEGAARNESS